MSPLPSQEQLNDLCLRALIRAFRKEAGPLPVSSPRLSSADLHSVRLHWALSVWIEDLAKRVVQRPREAQEVLDHEAVVTQGEIPGILNARATIIEQTVSGNPCLFVGEEPNTTLFSGPNHVVAWTLNEALRLILWAQRRNAGPGTPEWLSERAKLLEGALRTHALREVLTSPSARLKPGAAAVRAAGKSRVPLYHLATRAFRALEDVEGRDPVRLREMFSQTLVSSMEDWRKFELAAALCAADGLSVATGQPVEMDLTLVPGKPLARIGDYSVKWQLPQPVRQAVQLDPSEALTRKIAGSLGVSQAAGRADCAVFHGNYTVPVSLIECKWFESESSRDEALFGACSQLVGYARDAYPNEIGEAEKLLQLSLILVTSRGEAPRVLDGSGPVNCGDFNDIDGNASERWTRLLVRSRMPVAPAGQQVFLPSAPNPP